MIIQWKPCCILTPETLFCSSIGLLSLHTGSKHSKQRPPSVWEDQEGGGEMRSSHILIIQRDLMGWIRCCVEWVYLYGTAGLLSGVEWLGWIRCCVERVYLYGTAGLLSGVVGLVSAVSYESSRKGQGDEWVFGWNDQSWRLFLFRSCSYFRHNNTQTELPLVARSGIVVYVEHRAGTLCRRVIVSEAVEGQSSDHMCTNVLFFLLCVCVWFISEAFLLHFLKSSSHPDSNE